MDEVRVLAGNIITWGPQAKRFVSEALHMGAYSGFAFCEVHVHASNIDAVYDELAGLGLKAALSLPRQSTKSDSGTRGGSMVAFLKHLSTSTSR